MSGFVLPKAVFRLTDPPPEEARPFPFGLGAEGLHEVCETTYGDKAAATGFALAAMVPRTGPLVWITDRLARQEHGRMLELGLAEIRPDHPPLLHVDVSRPSDALWATEEVVSSDAAAAVIAELQDLDFTASRRLRLAAIRGGVPIILLLPHSREGSTAACARWRVRGQASAENPFDRAAPGPARWHAVLEKSRTPGAQAGTSFDVERNDETLSVSVVSRLATDPPPPRPLPQGEVTPFRPQRYG